MWIGSRWEISTRFRGQMIHGGGLGVENSIGVRWDCCDGRWWRGIGIDWEKEGGDGMRWGVCNLEALVLHKTILIGTK